VSNPANKHGAVRFQEFFQHKEEATQVLDWWIASQNADPARNEVREWAISYVAKIVAREARSVTKSKLLQTVGRTVNQEFVETFSLANLHDTLQESASTAMKVLGAFTTSHLAEKKHSVARHARTKAVIIFPNLSWSFLKDFPGRYFNCPDMFGRVQPF
jgi:hypothetical protein